MPRHRVRIEDRKRSVRACEACRLSRKRCDSRLPCSSCSRKGHGASCVYGDRAKLSPSNRIGSSRDREGLQINHEARKEDDPQPLLTQDARMLLTSKGEKVYVGKTAAISMLQFLRNVLRRFAGPSTFTESRRSNTMLEATLRSTSHRPTDFVDTNLDLLERTEIIHYYKVATNGFLNLLTDGILKQLNSESITESEYEDASLKDDKIAAYIVIAIGAHCRGNGDKDVKTSSNYFAEAQRLGFQDMLLNPSLSMVRNFLLMAFYMFCACRRNTGLLYLGVASRAATILGLHLPELNATLPADIRTVRVQIWKSLRVLDLICNSLLGRPSGTQDIQPEVQEAKGKIELLSHSTMTLDAMFESCSIVELIAQKITRDGTLDTTTAEGFLQKLRGWAHSLPPTLRQLIARDNDGCMEDNHQQAAIGNIHVACNYYFGVMLATRQFLISETITWLQQKQANRGDLVQSFTLSTSDAKAQELSRACTDSATYLIQMCHDTSASDFLLGNMCILQAWVFAAGLVLGLSLLRPPETSSSESHFYFSSSQNVLKRIAKLSPQAQRYAEILSDFSRAIGGYHRQLQKDSSSNNLLLERILKPPSSNDSGNNTTGLPSPMISTMGYCSTEEGDAPSIDLLDGMLIHEPSAIALSLQNADDFGFNILWDDYMSTTEQQDVSFNENFEQSSWRLNDLNSNLYQEESGP